MRERSRAKKDLVGEVNRKTNLGKPLVKQPAPKGAQSTLLCNSTAAQNLCSVLVCHQRDNTKQMKKQLGLVQDQRCTSA